MTDEEDYIFGEMPSEEDLIRMNYRIQHYINVMQGPQWQAICQLGPIEEFEDPFEDPNELAKFMISEYREWFHFLTSDGEEINAELFLHDDVQELVYDDSVNDLISSSSLNTNESNLSFHRLTCFKDFINSSANKIKSSSFIHKFSLPEISIVFVAQFSSAVSSLFLEQETNNKLNSKLNISFLLFEIFTIYRICFFLYLIQTPKWLYYIVYNFHNN